MNPKSNSDLLKMIGGGVIIAGACLIMFPDFLGYFGSIFRLLTVVLVAILVAAFVVRMFYKIRAPKAGMRLDPNQDAAATSSAANDTKSDT